MANDIRISIGLDGVPGVQAGATQASKAIGDIGKAGQVSAAQTAAAMRTLPAQFTDIATALQGGQSPLTVLLQQGGQIKDAFGGIGPAARALGGYVAGLVNPFTLAAAAAAGLAVAYAKGAAESDAYARALILSGNAAGTTAGRLADAAKRIDGVVGTQGAAAEALTKFAAASNIDPSGLERFAAAAVRMERATGVAVDATVKQFEDLGKTPLEAAAKLNESTNFLTASVYRQIKALSDAGRTAEAAAVAQNAYADALTQRSAQVEERLGLFERGWRGVKDAATEAWDAMLNVGRADTLQDKLAAAQRDLEQRQQRGPLNSQTAAAFEKGNAALRERIASMQEQVRLEGRAATAAGDAARQLRARIDWDKDGLKYLSDEAKLQKEIAQARIAGAAAGATQEEIDKRIADLRAKAPKPKDGADPFAADRDAARAWADAWADFTRIAADAQAKTDGLSKGQARLVEYLQSPAYANASEPMRQLALQQAYAAISAEQHAERLKDDAEALKQATAESDRYVAALQRSAASVGDQAQKLEDEGAAARLAAAEHITLAKAVERITVARLREAQAIELSYGNDAAAEAIQREIEARQRLANAMDDKDARAAADKLRKDEAREWEKIWDQVGQSFTDALMDGGRSAKRLLQDLFRTMVLRPLVQPVIGAVSSAIGMPASASSIGSSLGSSGLSSWSSMAGLSSYASIFKAGSQMAMSGGTVASLQGSAAMIGQGQYAAGLSQGAGTVAPYLAAYGIGRSVGIGISGGYGLGGGSGNAAVNVGAAIGTIWGPVGTAVGAAIGGLVNRAFGKKLSDSGLDITLGGAAGVSGSTFRQFEGGWFSSGGTDRGALDAETAQALRDAVGTTREYAKQYAEAIGLSAASVDTYTESIRISLKGLSAEQQQQAITDALGKFADGIAKSLGGGIDALSLKGESSAQTLARLAGNISAVNGVLDTLNARLLATSVAGADAAGKLIDAFGGVEAFAQQTSGYLEAFYSESERAAVTTRQLSSQLGKLGIALPSSRDEFRKLVDAQDLTTDSGRKTYAALLGMSAAFASITKQAEAAALSTSGLVSEIERLRGGGADSGSLGLAELQARFVTTTAQARAGSQSAVDALPTLSKAIEEAASASARSAVDLASMRAYLAGSLGETLARTGGMTASAVDAGGTITATSPAQTSGASGTTQLAPDVLLTELQALRSELAALRSEQQIQAAGIVANTGKTARLIERVMPENDAIAVRVLA